MVLICIYNDLLNVNFSNISNTVTEKSTVLNVIEGAIASFLNVCFMNAKVSKVKASYTVIDNASITNVSFKNAVVNNVILMCAL